MNTDDPKFTAHLLGELNELTPDERAEIEELLCSDATAAAEAAETRALAARLRRELQGEEALPLTPAQRAMVLASRVPGVRMEGAKLIAFPRRLMILSAIAACLVVGTCMALFFRTVEADKAATRSSLAKNAAQQATTVTLLPEPEQPARQPLLAPDVAAAAKSDLKPAEGGIPAESNSLLAHQPQPLNLPLPTPPNPVPSSRPALMIAAATQPPAPGAPKSLAGAELKLAASAHSGGAPAGNEPAAKPDGALPSATGLSAAIRGSAGLGGSGQAKSALKPQLGPFETDRLANLRAFRQLDDENVGKKMVREGTPQVTRAPSAPGNAEADNAVTDNAFLSVRETPLSTFSIEVDTASYATVRRFLNEGQLPPKGAVRIEELLNHFTYDYPQLKGDAAFSTTTEVATCPWTPAHRLVRIGLKGRGISQEQRKAGTPATIARDVKIQVEFNPAQVSGYRLIGDERRLLTKEDFRDDQKNAGEIGAGHTVTALYEIVPAGKDQLAKADELKYLRPPAVAEKSKVSAELLTVKLRYKAPDGTAKLLEFPLTDAGTAWQKSSRDFRFAAAVAGYGMLLRDSPHKGSATWGSVHELAVEGKGEDVGGSRTEFISLLEKAAALTR